MSKKGTRIYCPACKTFSTCKVISPARLGKPKAQRWQRTDHKDIAWFRRGRKCLNCSFEFLTAELDERFIMELVTLRNLAARNNATKVNRIRKQIPWLHQNESIPLELAQRFIETSAWWLSHASGNAVRAPGHAERVYMSDHGWSIDFGANTFLVGKAIERCKNTLNCYFDKASIGQIPFLSEVSESLKFQISGAVANIDGNEYTGYYPVYDDDLVFGTQTIDVKDATNFIIRESGIEELLLAI